MICPHCQKETEEPLFYKLDVIEHIVCDYFGVKRFRLKNPSNIYSDVYARSCIVFFSRKYLGFADKVCADRYAITRSSVAHNVAKLKRCLVSQTYISHHIISIDYEIRKRFALIERENNRVSAGGIVAQEL